MSKNLPERIWLCGFMGAGKSSIGEILARELDRKFLDLDRRISDQAGLEIPEIFAREGEEGFRRRERDALREASRKFSGVVALGGGALQDRILVDLLKRSGLLIFIDPPFSVIFNRIKGGSGRPLAEAAGRRADTQGEADDPDGRTEKQKKELKALYRRRKPLYEQAELVLRPRGGESAEELAVQLITKIRTHV